MEVSGSVLRRSSVCPSVPRVRVSARGGLGFSDEGHLRYYLPPLRLKCGGGKEAKEKKRSRLLKGLSKDLSAFYSMGFGINDGLAGEVKERTVSPKSEDRIDSKPGFGISSSCCSPEISGSDRIEVCMGGKCKKSGALELMAEFERKVGAEGAVVVGCKCMGKCRDGPNVRVLNRGNDEEEKRSLTTNPLFIGVGLDDVGSIVDGLFGKQRSDLGLMTT